VVLRRRCDRRWETGDRRQLRQSWPSPQPRHTNHPYHLSRFFYCSVHLYALYYATVRLATSSFIQLSTSAYTHLFHVFIFFINSFVPLFIFTNISSFTDLFILLSSHFPFHFPSFILSFSVYSSASILHFFIYSLLQCDGMGIPRGESCNPHQTSHKPTIMVRRRTAQWRTLSFAEDHPR